MKKLFRILLLFAAHMCIGQYVLAFDGSTLTDGGQYYLYNMYQSKFLSYGNSWGTQTSLDNSKPLLCTINASGNGYTINTHYSLTDKAYKASYDNYVCLVSGTPVVNANYGDADESYTHRDAQVFNFSAVDGGYNITYDSNGTTMALMFGAGSACTVDTLSKSFNANKSLWKLISADEYKAYKAKTRFTVASLNVDGMPKTISIMGVYNYTLNPDAKEADGATAIGSKLNSMGYDFIALSEDFNFHDNIVSSIGDGFTFGTHRGKIETSATAYARIVSSKSPVFDTDGLGFVARNASGAFSNESWTAWNEHYGYTSDGADGLIDKGYRYYTITLTDGTQVDVYTLHMDAETSDADNAARATQIKQLAATIIASNNGRPVIVMGDTNCRYTRDQIKSLFIDVLNADDRFTVKDPWIEYGRDGVYPACNGNSIMVGTEGYLKGEVVDKIFYINNKKSDIRIKALNYTQDLSFINDSGEPLADHWPAVVEFDYHKYDPTIDDASNTDFSDDTYYFRNKETGAFLKAGGWWGTHAVQGNYGSPMSITKLTDGKYSINSNIGGLTQGDPYMDGTACSWSFVEDNGYYSFIYDDNGTAKALTGNDPTTFPASPGPNTRYVTCANYDSSDDYQKWEILNASQMLALVKKGTSDNPANATHLLKGANFSRNDGDGNATWTGWPTSATRMTSNKSDGKNDFAFGNSCAEVYVAACTKTEFSCSHETKWAITQTISDLPKGTYRVTCQAFQRISNSTSTTADIYVHANDNKIMVPLMYTEPKITDSSFGGTTQSGSYYYPNSMAEATLYFNAGYYVTQVPDVTVTDGTLTISIDKTSDTGKSNTAWTCFDNFQIYYLGNPDAKTYYTGDMNGDDKVDITDVSILVNKLDSNASPTDEAGDMNSDGKYNMTDLDLITKEILDNNFSTYMK